MSEMTYPRAVFWLLCVQIGVVGAVAMRYPAVAAVLAGMTLILVLYIQAVGERDD